jgi:phosphoglycolate phosphatase
MKLHLDSLSLPQPADRVLHIAPEKGISSFLRKAVGDKYYDPADIEPERFGFCNAREFDLCRDAESLPLDHYKLILHSHVLEHLRCNWTAVLFFLHRALQHGGYHIFSIPILDGCYEVDLGPLSHEEAAQRFGQDDHVRRVGRADLRQTLGMVFKGDLDRHRIGVRFAGEVLREINIPRNLWNTLNGSTVFTFGKNDLRLTS